MNRNHLQRHQAIRMWTATFVTCVGALAALLVVDNVAPMFLENSLPGFTVRLALATLCLTGFITAHRRMVSVQIQRQN